MIEDNLNKNYMVEENLKKVLRYIEDNIRVSEQTSIEYLDSNGLIERLTTKQNHIIFGRRGSGKSLLLKSLRGNEKFTCINVNLEDFKDISFPNSILQVQKSIIKQLLPIVKQRYKKISLKYCTETIPLCKKLQNQIKNLDLQISSPDDYDKSISEKQTGKISAKIKMASGLKDGEIGAEGSRETETSKRIKIDKLDILKNDLPNIKDLFTQVSIHIEKDILLILDDFYFIKKDEQPYFLDYFHRMAKNVPLYLKVATIQHRSKLYVQDESYIGMELQHDALPIYLDYGLQDFDKLVAFMRQLLLHINDKVGVKIDYKTLITDSAFRFLCLASGGVPRDFFSLLIALEPLFNRGKSITKPNVIDKSIENMQSKMDSMKKDAADEGFLLEQYLNIIKNEIIETKKWNAFLLSNSEVKKFPQINQAIKELVDLRFIHLVEQNTSASSSDGTRYSAYMMDIGLFPNSNPRKFQQVEPGQMDDRYRKDKIRSAPKLNLQVIYAQIESFNLKNSLEITHE